MTKKTFNEANVNTMVEFLRKAFKEVDLVRQNHNVSVTFNDYSFYLNTLAYHMEEDYSFEYRDRLKAIYDAFELLKYEEEINRIEYIEGYEWEENDMGNFEKSISYKTTVDLLYFVIDSTIKRIEFIERGNRIFLS